MIFETALIDREKETAPTSAAIELVSIRGESFRRCGEPVTLGVPFLKGACTGKGNHSVQLIDRHGRRTPVQIKALDAWSDGSLRWALVDFQADVTSGTEKSVYELRIGPAAIFSSPCVTISDVQGRITVDTGCARFSVSQHGSFPFDDVTVAGEPVIAARRSTLQLEAADGFIHSVRIAHIKVEETGPLRAVIAIHGWMGRKKRSPLVEVIARLHFFAGHSTVQVDLTVRNPRRARHPGGYWDLGDGGSVYLKDLSLLFALPEEMGSSHIRCSPEPGVPFGDVGDSLEVYQDSSGGDNWRSSNHINRYHEVPLQFRGYRLTANGVESSGRRATPIVSVERGGRRLVITMPYFWQNFPKSIEATSDGIVLGLFPRQYSDVHELQGGEQKTHTFYVCFGRDAVSDLPLEWCRQRLLARLGPSWYCSTGAVPYLTTAADDPHPTYLRLVNAAIEGDDTFEHKREVVDEYGWRHFGDIYGDHEAVGRAEMRPLVSHFNNQYDAIAGFAYQFLRSGDPRWWIQMEELANHVIDIDIYHTDRDKSAYNRGLFWHTSHYVDADTATHRCYPAASRGGGGGPSAEHNYTTGLMLHHFLTGDPRSREAAIDLARFVVDMDDGRKTVFRWLSRRPTGLATASGSVLYHGPGRAGGNSLNALIDGHRLTGEPALLEKADEIIRRVIHPTDDVTAHDLLDAERRWFYTVFLQSLGKYLDCKAERGELDQMYAYARTSLLAYARWMAVNEYPYLDKQEILEHPTETWAAQDMRKSEVFKYAAKHSVSEEERARFLERAEFFFGSSTKTLLAMNTRTLARPVVLMLANGLMHAYFKLHPEAVRSFAAADDIEWGEREAFVPQKVAAKTRCLAVSAALLSALAGLAAIGAWIGVNTRAR